MILNVDDLHVFTKVLITENRHSLLIAISRSQPTPFAVLRYQAIICKSHFGFSDIANECPSKFLTEKQKTNCISSMYRFHHAHGGGNFIFFYFFRLMTWKNINALFIEVESTLLEDGEKMDFDRASTSIHSTLTELPFLCNPQASNSSITQTRISEKINYLRLSSIIIYQGGCFFIVC